MAPSRREDLLDYAFHRLAVYLGAREAHFVAFIGAGARIDGWLAVEAFYAFTRPLFARSIPGVRLKGEGPDAPHLELDLEGRPHALLLRSLPLTPQRPLSSYFSEGGEVPPLFQRLAERGEEASLVLVAYPLRMDDPAWTGTVEQAQKDYPVRCLKSLQFPLPGPQRVTLSLWRPA